MKHIVFVLGSYYPNYSAVGKCMGNIASVMAQTNRVTVIGTQTQLNQLSSEAYQNQHIVRVTTVAEKRRLKVDKLVAESTGIWRYIARAIQWTVRVGGVLKVFSTFKTVDRQLIKAYHTALKQLEEPIDVIIPTCVPFESVVAAIKYKDTHPSVALLPCLYDLFTANRNLNRTSWNTKLKWNNNLKLEREMFEKSQHVFHVSNWTSHIEQHHKVYNKKHTEIEHPLLVCPMNQSCYQSASKIRVVYTGVVDEKNRNPQGALQMLAQIKNKRIICEFYSFGSAQSIVEQFAANNSTIIAHGKVENQVAEIARAQATVLISIGNKDSTQVPSKLIEYMATGKPILHFVLNPQDTSIQLLNNYPASKIIYTNSPLSGEELESFIIENQHTLIPFENVREWLLQATPEEVSSNLKKHSGGAIY